MVVINHPPHYTRGNIEVWDFIRDQDLNYHLGNAIKYICRAGYKDSKVDDLRKAIHYLENELTHSMPQQSFGTGDSISDVLWCDEFEGQPDYATDFDR